MFYGFHVIIAYTYNTRVYCTNNKKKTWTVFPSSLYSLMPLALDSDIFCSGFRLFFLPDGINTRVQTNKQMTIIQSN